GGWAAPTSWSSSRPPCPAPRTTAPPPASTTSPSTRVRRTTSTGSSRRPRRTAGHCCSPTATRTPAGRTPTPGTSSTSTATRWSSSPRPRTGGEPPARSVGRGAVRIRRGRPARGGLDPGQEPGHGGRRHGDLDRRVVAGTAEDDPLRWQRQPFGPGRAATALHRQALARQHPARSGYEADQAVPPQLVTDGPADARRPAAAGDQRRQPEVQGDGAALPYEPPAPDEQQEQQRQHDESADADPFQDLHRRSPQCAGRGSAGAAVSARTVTPSDVTDRNPPDTSQVSSSPDSGFTRTCPGSASWPSSGACPGRIPSSPSVVR